MLGRVRVLILGPNDRISCHLVLSGPVIMRLWTVSSWLSDCWSVKWPGRHGSCRESGSTRSFTNFVRSKVSSHVMRACKVCIEYSTMRIGSSLVPSVAHIPIELISYLLFKDYI